VVPEGDKVGTSRHDAVFDIIVMDANGANALQITVDAGHNENSLVARRAQDRVQPTRWCAAVT
jgi:hypothetical protein